MNKFAKTLIKIVYYVLAVLFGVILVLTLPYILLNSQLTQEMNDNLENGEFVDAMHLIGCYYDSEIAYLYEDAQKDIQLVLFRATPFVDTTYTQVDSYGNSTEIVSQETIELGYFGFLCNVTDKYDTSSSEEADDYENKTKLVVNDEYNVFLLDYDDSQNGKADSIITTLTGSYVSFQIPMGSVDEIEKLEFVDKEGKVYLSINTTNSSYGKLDFNHKFFSEFEDFLVDYNDLAKNKALGTITEDDFTTKQTELQKTVGEILDSNAGYRVGSYTGSIGGAQTKSYVISIFYFLGVFILGDLLVGKRMTITIIKTIFKPVVKAFSKKKKEEETNENYEYFSQVVITLKVPTDFELQPKMTLVRNNIEEVFEFTKENSYISKRRIHAGIYDQLRFECDEYKVLNLPEQIEVKGFKTEIELELEKE